MRITLHEEPRQCGECSLCCKVMGVSEGDFHKPKDQWCVHAKKGHGCSIYDTRPTKCRDFECLWLQSRFGGPQHRPDKIHAVITPTSDGQNLVIHEDPGYAGHARALLKPQITLWLDQGMERYVVVVCGDNRSFLGDVRMFERLQANESPEVVGAKNLTTKTR